MGKKRGRKTAFILRAEAVRCCDGVIQIQVTTGGDDIDAYVPDQIATELGERLRALTGGARVVELRR